jgi:hypothetical protein
MFRCDVSLKWICTPHVNWMEWLFSWESVLLSLESVKYIPYASLLTWWILRISSVHLANMVWVTSPLVEWPTVTCCGSRHFCSVFFVKIFFIWVKALVLAALTFARFL